MLGSMNRCSRLLAIAFLIPFILEPLSALEKPWLDTSKPVAERVTLLLAQMTLAEKTGQMVQAERGALQPGDVRTYGIGSVLSGGGSLPASNTPAGWIELFNRLQTESLNTRLGVPILYGIDAVHGHNNVYGATIFPHNLGLGAARDPELMEQIGRVTALEVAATGLNWTFAPCVAVVQDIRWGRTYESYGESRELQTLLTARLVQGLQGAQGTVDWLSGAHIVATAKHFLGDGGVLYETGEGSTTIDRGNVEIPLEQLKALHGQGYVEAIRAGVQTIMASFSSYQGVHMHANKALLTDWLKAPVASGGLGFGGFVIGDWDAMGLTTEVKGDYAAKVLNSFNAGVDMAMEQSNWRKVIEILLASVKNGSIGQARIDDAVRRILTVKFNAGLFEHPLATNQYSDQLGSAVNRAVAARAVKESLVLLKNDKKLLPLKPGARVFVAGPMADNVGRQCGGWTLSWQGGFDRKVGKKVTRLTPGTTLLEGLQAQAKAGGGEIITDVARLAQASVAVIAVGETPYAEMQGDIQLGGKMTLDSPGRMSAGNREAIAQALDAGVPVVVVLVSGRPLVVTDELSKWGALVVAWLPGSEGAAIAEVLYGQEDFRGKLPVTWPRSVEDLPAAGSKTALFPYGFGLSLR